MTYSVHITDGIHSTAVYGMTHATARALTDYLLSATQLIGVELREHAA